MEPQASNVTGVNQLSESPDAATRNGPPIGNPLVAAASPEVETALATLLKKPAGDTRHHGTKEAKEYLARLTSKQMWGDVDSIDKRFPNLDRHFRWEVVQAAFTLQYDKEYQGIGNGGH